MKRIGEASHVMAEAVKLCEPKVVSIYPITPQTHICEALTEHVANGELKAEVIRTESEHSMMSALIGASLCGVRCFSASSSQGLALAHEILHVIAGMRLPVVIGVVNRALSAPINIWGDHSDAMTSRDTSWIQLYCKNSQEIFDTTIQAFSIAEKLALPVMVNIDGFTLSHTFEPVDLLSKAQVQKFLPAFKIKHTFDTKNPKTFGPIGFPDSYMEFKHQQKNAMEKARKVITDENRRFGKMFRRKYGDGLIEVFNPRAKKMIVCSGTTALTATELGVGVIHVKSFRPFPFKEIAKACKGKDVFVIDRAYSYGAGGPLYLNVKTVIPKARSAIMGLGGREINPDDLRKVLKSKKEEIWVDKL